MGSTGCQIVRITAMNLVKCWSRSSSQWPHNCRQISGCRNRNCISSQTPHYAWSWKVLFVQLAPKKQQPSAGNGIGFDASLGFGGQPAPSAPVWVEENTQQQNTFFPANTNTANVNGWKRRK